MIRPDGRRPDQLRPVRMTRDYIKYAEGSVFIEVGDTKVVCTASVEDRVPPFVKGTGSGWVTAEYSMLPRSTQTRNMRESTRGRQGGRTFEIQRLIGRALRSVVDLSKLGERTIWIDCDVIQADGGTRTTSITGSFIALMDALVKMGKSENSTTFPVTDFLASTSVGIVDGRPVLDLSFAEDSRAQVDMNVVMTGAGRVVEIQGTAEEYPFTREQLDQLIDLAQSGISRLIDVQKRLIPASVLEKMGGTKSAKIIARNEE